MILEDPRVCLFRSHSLSLYLSFLKCISHLNSCSFLLRGSIGAITFPFIDLCGRSTEDVIEQNELLVPCSHLLGQLWTTFNPRQD